MSRRRWGGWGTRSLTAGSAPSEAVKIIGLGRQNTDMNVRATLQTQYLRASGTGIPACVPIFLQLLTVAARKRF